MVARWATQMWTTRWVSTFTRKYLIINILLQFIIHLRYADKPVIVTLRSALHSAVSHNIRFIARTLNSSFVKYGLDVQGTAFASSFSSACVDYALSRATDCVPKHEAS